jgi:hypothetical protein
MIENAINVVTTFAFDGASKLVSIPVGIIGNAGTTYGRSVEAGTYKFSNITAYLNYGYGIIPVPVLIEEDPDGEIRTQPLYHD